MKNRVSEIIDVATLSTFEINAIIRDLISIRALPQNVLVHESVLDFSKDVLVLKLGSTIDFDVLFNAYVDYCSINNHSPLKKSVFNKAFRNHINNHQDFVGIVISRGKNKILVNNISFQSQLVF